MRVVVGRRRKRSWALWVTLDRRAWHRLPAFQLVALRLLDFGGLDFRQAAEAVDLPAFIRRLILDQETFVILNQYEVLPIALQGFSGGIEHALFVGFTADLLQACSFRWFVHGSLVCCELCGSTDLNSMLMRVGV